MNQLLFGDYAAMVSISYVPLVVLLAAYSLRLVRVELDRTLAVLLVGVGLITAISARHLITSFDPFLVKFPLFFLFAILVALNTTDADIRAIMRVTYLCAAAYVCVGIPLWYVNVLGGVLTPASFSEAMFFQKQDYTVVLTLLAGMFLYEFLLSETPGARRRYLMAFQVTAIAIGATLFYIKTLFVVVISSITTLWLFGVHRARKYVLLMALGLVVLYGTYERVIVSDLLPEQAVAYVAWLFDDRFLTPEGARSLDTLTMRLAILGDNFDAMRGHVSSLVFGIGTNTAADASFISDLSGREGDLPVEMESGLVQIFVYTGGVGLCIVLFSYLYPFMVWVAARRRVPQRPDSTFARVIAVNIALLASNIFQDNLASVTWYWLGLLWYCVVRHRRAERLVAVEQPRTYLSSTYGSRQGVAS